jgi:hypothetical protein
MPNPPMKAMACDGLACLSTTPVVVPTPIVTMRPALRIASYRLRLATTGLTGRTLPSEPPPPRQPVLL